MNVIRVLDSTTYAEIASIENVINPLITEEINGVFNFEFETVYDEVSKFASGGNIIGIEDDYFRIATTTKNLDGTYRVFAEHVSFALTRAFFEDYVGEGIDGTASEILTPMLNQIGWGIGSIIETPVKYYKPSQGASVRKQILDIANLFGLEIIWEKFSVSLVAKRGSQQLTEFKLGENLLGVSETIDLTGEVPETSYEVDVLDLSQLEGYENFKKINLGDVVHIIAQNIDLEGISRVVYRQYNPFGKVNVNLQIGFIARDFTNYERDEDEDEEEVEKEIWLESFTVDGNDILSLDDVDATDGSAGALLDVNEIPKTIVITVKPKYQEYFIAVNIEQNGKHTNLILDDEFTNGSITINNVFTKDFLSGAIKIGMSDKPFNTPRADTRSYFVDLNLTNAIENFMLDYFEIDNEDVLSLPDIDTPAGAIHTIYDQVQKVKIKLKTDEIFDDVKVEFFDGGESTGPYDQSHFKSGILTVHTRAHSFSKGLRIEITLKQGDETYTYIVSCERYEEEPIEPMGPSYYIESETVKATSGGAQFDFTVPYDAVISVTLGVGQTEQEEPITAYWSLIQDESDMYTGVYVDVKGFDSGSIDVSVQAVCQEGVEEQEEEGEPIG